MRGIPLPNNDSHAPDCTGSRQIYVASSWRNQLQQTVVQLLRSRGHRVYDFKHPDDTVDRGFHWGDAGLEHSNPIDGDPRAVDLAAAGDFVAALSDRAAIQAFHRDFDAMVDADTFVLVLPCGRSAHLELGWAVAAGKRTAVLLDDPCTPELMYRMVDRLAARLEDLVEWLAPSGAEALWP
jgi:hypothetical protein